MLKYLFFLKCIIILYIFYPQHVFAQEKLRINITPISVVDTIENEIKVLKLKHINVENISLAHAKIQNVMGMNGYFKVFKKVNEEYLLIDSICEVIEDFIIPKGGIKTIAFKKGTKIDIPKVFPPICTLVKNGGDYRVKYFFHCLVNGKQVVFEAGTSDVFIK